MASEWGDCINLDFGDRPQRWAPGLSSRTGADAWKLGTTGTRTPWAVRSGYDKMRDFAHFPPHRPRLYDLYAADQSDFRRRPLRVA